MPVELLEGNLKFGRKMRRASTGSRDNRLYKLQSTVDEVQSYCTYVPLHYEVQRLLYVRSFPFLMKFIKGTHLEHYQNLEKMSKYVKKY